MSMSFGIVADLEDELAELKVEAITELRTRLLREPLLHGDAEHRKWLTDTITEICRTLIDEYRSA